MKIKEILRIFFILIFSFSCMKNEKKNIKEEINFKELGEAMSTLMDWNSEKIIFHYTRHKILFYLDMPIYEIKDVYTKEIIDRMLDVYSQILEKEGKKNIGFRILYMDIKRCSNGWHSISITCMGKYPKYLFFTDLTFHEDRLKQIYISDKSKILNYIREIGGLLIYRGFYFIINKEFDVRGILQKSGLYVMMPITIMSEEVPIIDDYEEFSVLFFLKKGKVRYSYGGGHMKEFVSMFEKNLPDEWKEWMGAVLECR